MTVDERTLLAGRQLPAALLQDSAELGWRDVLCRTYRERSTRDEFDSLATPDVGLVIVTSGTYVLETTRGSRWVSASFRPGSVALVLPDEAGSVRWRATSPEPMQSVHLHLAAALMRQVLDVAGQTTLVRPVHGVDLRSPYLFHAVQSIEAAARVGAPSLLAESLAAGVAAHLAISSRPPANRPAGTGLSPRALADVMTYLHDNMAADIRLDRLASVAYLTKWHFLRQFKRSTGQTPYAYLREIRVEHAKALLERGATAEAAAHASGLGSVSQLSRAFRRVVGVTPGAYRAAARPDQTGAAGRPRS